MANRTALKEFFGSISAVFTTAAGNDQAALAEDDGTARVQLIGYDGTNQQRIETETTGELKTVLYGKDSGANVDPLRTNADQQLQVEIVDSFGTGTPKVLGTANPAATTNTALYNVATGGTAKITALTAANRGATTVTIRVGIDVGGNGTNTPGDAEWIYYDLPIQGNDTLVLDAAQGYWLSTDDDLVVYASTQQVAFIASGIEYA